LQTSTPGRFLTAFGKFYVAPSYTKSGPFLNLYLWFLILPMPGLTAFESITLSTSSKAPNLFKNAIISFVFYTLSNLSSTTNGIYGTSLIL